MRRRYLVSGLVQGVGFRYFTADRARRQGIDGWVRNLPDGRVEIDAEGEPDALRQFEDDVRRGPRGASVERVDTEEPPAGAHAGRGFSIR